MMQNPVAYSEADPFGEGTQAEAVNASTTGATEYWIMSAARTAKGQQGVPNRVNDGARCSTILKSSSIVLGRASGCRNARVAGGRYW